MAIIDLRKGDALSLRVTLSDTEAPSRDWTTWEIEASMSYALCSEVNFEVTWLDHPGGVAKIRLDAAATEALTHEGDYKLRVRVIDPDGDPISTKPEIVRVTA